MNVTTLYHAASSEIDVVTWDDICLAEDADDALPYLEGLGGWLHTIILDITAPIADEGDLLDAGNDLGINGADMALAYQLADSRKVRGHLASLGFSGVRYGDMGPDNAYSHETVRVWDALTLTVTSAVEIDED